MLRYEKKIYLIIMNPKSGSEDELIVTYSVCRLIACATLPRFFIDFHRFFPLNVVFVYPLVRRLHILTLKGRKKI